MCDVNLRGLTTVRMLESFTLQYCTTFVRAYYGNVLVNWDDEIKNRVAYTYCSSIFFPPLFCAAAAGHCSTVANEKQSQVNEQRTKKAQLYVHDP